MLRNAGPPLEGVNVGYQLLGNLIPQNSGSKVALDSSFRVLQCAKEVNVVSRGTPTSPTQLTVGIDQLVFSGKCHTVRNEHL